MIAKTCCQLWPFLVTNLVENRAVTLHLSRVRRMNVSTDSQIEFEIELDTSEGDMADPGHSEPSHSTVNVAADVANIDNPVESVC